MIPANKSKLIKSLHRKKDRDETGFFLVEGEKCVGEVLSSDFEVEYLAITTLFFENYKQVIEEKNISYDIVGQNDLERVGSLESNNSAIAIAKQKKQISPIIGKKEIVIALDEIKDPGNFGTIIRIADWYGIDKIIASKNSVDFYNNKTISASMGSFLRVEVFYEDLIEFLPKLNLPIFGAFLDGENIHKISFPSSGILLMGNESRGVSQEIAKLITKKIAIVPFGKAESLNVAIATAVILDNWRRTFN